MRRTGDEQIPDLPTHRHEEVQVKRLKSNLRRTGIVEPGLGGEVGVQPLGSWRQLANPLRSVEEGRGSGDEQVEPRKPPGIQFINPLAKRIQGLVASVGADPLERLDFINDDHQPCVTGIPQHQQ